MPALSHTLSDRTSALLTPRAPQVYAPASLPGAAGGDVEALRATFEASLEPQARARLRRDPALDLVAAATAENFSDQGESPSPSLVQWTFWRSGSLALYLDHRGGYGSGGRGLASLQDWARKAGEHMNAYPGQAISYGLARFSEGKVSSEMMVFGVATFDAPAFPKTYAPGGPLSLALQPRTPLREIRFLLDRGDAVDAQIVKPRPDGSFFVSQAVPSKPGRYFIEVQGPPPLRPTLLCAPIYVGVPEPTAPDEVIQHPPPGPADLAGWPAWIASAIDAERARLGRPPLEISAPLALLAGERSEALAAGRNLPATDAPLFLARLASTGVQARDHHETALTVHGTDTVLLDLLRPSRRERLVLAARVRFGAAVTPRPVKNAQKDAPSLTLVEETATTP